MGEEGPTEARQKHGLAKVGSGLRSKFWPTTGAHGSDFNENSCFRREFQNVPVFFCFFVFENPVLFKNELVFGMLPRRALPREVVDVERAFRT